MLFCFMRLHKMISDLLTNYDRRLQLSGSAVSLVQPPAAAALSSHSVRLARGSNQHCAKTPLSCAFVGHLLCTDKDRAVSLFATQHRVLEIIIWPLYCCGIYIRYISALTYAFCSRVDSYNAGCKTRLFSKGCVKRKSTSATLWLHHWDTENLHFAALGSCSARVSESAGSKHGLAGLPTARCGSTGWNACFLLGGTFTVGWLGLILGGELKQLTHAAHHLNLHTAEMLN